MTISQFSQWDGTTAANNVDLNDVPLTENQTRPAHVNNLFREMMKQLKASSGLGGLFTAWTAASASGAASLDFHEDTDNGTNRVRLQGAASTADVTLTLPGETATVQTRVASTTDHAVARYDGTAGVQQDSAVIVDDSGNVSGVGTYSGGAMTLSAQQVLNAIWTDDGAGAGPLIVFNRVSTTPAVNDLIAQFRWGGRNSTPAFVNYGIMSGTILDPTAGNEDFELGIATLVAGASVTNFKIANGVQIGAPTGGYKGAGTLNAVGVYDDNTLLTCYPFDAYLDGEIDDAKWDALVPDRIIPPVYEEREVEEEREGKPEKVLRQFLVEPERAEPRRHEEMRKFKARLGTETDPLDLDKYIAHWREKRHLTSLPNEAKFDPVQGLPAGAWIQRLVETVEIQAIHISQLHERLKAVEAAKGGRPEQQ